MSDRLNTLYEFLKGTTYFADPASTKYHGVFRGGLHDHSLRVQKHLVHLTDALDLKWECSKTSPKIVAVCHDLCKIGAYVEDGAGGYTYNQDHPKGHGDRSVEIAKSVIDLTEEEELCIRWHMGAYDLKENWNAFNEALKKYPNVLWTHNADMMAVHLDDGAELVIDGQYNVFDLRDSISERRRLTCINEMIMKALRQTEDYLGDKEEKYCGRGHVMSWPDYSAAFGVRAHLRSSIAGVTELMKLEGLK